VAKVDGVYDSSSKSVDQPHKVCPLYNNLVFKASLLDELRCLPLLPEGTVLTFFHSTRSPSYQALDLRLSFQ
jgi:hypothetical protein